jgi:serine/threonine-protein kinase RsbW
VKIDLRLVEYSPGSYSEYCTIPSSNLLRTLSCIYSSWVVFGCVFAALSTADAKYSAAKTQPNTTNYPPAEQIHYLFISFFCPFLIIYEVHHIGGGSMGFREPQISNNGSLPQLRVPAERKELAVIRGFVQAQAVSAGFSNESIDDLVLAVDEAATNIIIHGYEEKPGVIEVTYSSTNDTARITLRDWAPTFDPLQVPPPDITLPLHERKAGGLGIHLMRQCVDEICHRLPEDGGNELLLVKKMNLRE